MRAARKMFARDVLTTTIQFMKPRYTRFSEEWNALDYLEKTVEFIHRAEKYPTDWKWVILSLHGALYGFMICALKGTDHDRVLVRNKNDEPHLISFNKALKWCQDPAHMIMTTASTPLQLSECQKRSLDVLQFHFRNSFAHYQPCLWSIELHDMPQMVIDGLEITRFLGLESGNYMWLTDEARQRISGLVAEGVQVLQQSCLFREAHSPD
jgi:hypothetical protein